LKIGETTLEDDHGDFAAPCSDTLNKAAHKRIDQYTTTAGIAYTLLYTEMTVFFKMVQYARSMTNRCIAFWNALA
jgi:hypothetical protein